jgi:hypothetical protein
VPRKKQRTQDSATGDGMSDSTSRGWLEEFQETLSPDGPTIRLITELVKSGPVDADRWSKRTETEIRLAIQNADLLKNND